MGAELKARGGQEVHLLQSELPGQLRMQLSCGSVEDDLETRESFGVIATAVRVVVIASAKQYAIVVATENFIVG